MNALLLLDDGMAMTDVARVLYLDVRTVEEYRRLYETEGTLGVGALGYKGNPRVALNQDQVRALKAHMTRHFFLTSQAVCDYVLKEFKRSPRPTSSIRLMSSSVAPYI